MKEQVICSAIRAEDGSIFRGHRHSDAIDACKKERQKPKQGSENEGFITSLNRYVTKEEAQAIQKAAGIRSADPGRHSYSLKDGYNKNGELYSEDLY